MHLIKDENGNLVQHGHGQPMSILMQMELPILMSIHMERDMTMDIHIRIMAVRQDIAEAVRRETARMKHLHC